MSKLIITIAMLALLLTGCDEGTSSRYGGSGSTSATKEMIEANIDKMGAEKWNRKTYLEIKDKQIPELKLQSDKEVMLSLLNTTYGKVLVRDANEILDGTCSPSHKLLNDIIKEASGFTSTKGYEDMKEKYQKHQNLLNFIGSLSSRQKVTSFKDSYDESFEQTMTKRAQDHLKSNPNCKYIKDALSNPSSRFSNRRKAYCEAIVDLYIQKDEYLQRDENIVRGRLSVYSGDKKALYEKIEKFKTDCEAKLNQDASKEEIFL